MKPTSEMFDLFENSLDAIKNAKSQSEFDLATAAAMNRLVAWRKVGTLESWLDHFYDEFDAAVAKYKSKGEITEAELDKLQVV